MADELCLACMSSCAIATDHRINAECWHRLTTLLLASAFLHCAGDKLRRSLWRHLSYHLVRRLAVDVRRLRASFAVDAPIHSMSADSGFTLRTPLPPCHALPGAARGSSSGSAGASQPGPNPSRLGRPPRRPPPTARGAGSGGRHADLGQSSVLGSAATLSVRSLTVAHGAVANARAHQYGVLATSCQLSGLDLVVTAPALDGPALDGPALDAPALDGQPHQHRPPQGQHRPAQRPDRLRQQGADMQQRARQRREDGDGGCGGAREVHMVRRWSASATVSWRVASRLLDVVSGAKPVPVLQVLRGRTGRFDASCACETDVRLKASAMLGSGVFVWPPAGCDSALREGGRLRGADETECIASWISRISSVLW